jgi:hypothetical protein
MSQANYKVTITEHNYEYTRYIAWVSATSKNQALVKAAALAGQEKARREFERTGSRRGVAVDGLLEPEVTMETVGLDEYYEEEVTVSEH